MLKRRDSISFKEQKFDYVKLLFYKYPIIYRPTPKNVSRFINNAVIQIDISPFSEKVMNNLYSEWREREYETFGFQYFV